MNFQIEVGNLKEIDKTSIFISQSEAAKYNLTYGCKLNFQTKVGDNYPLKVIIKPDQYFTDPKTCLVNPFTQWYLQVRAEKFLPTLGCDPEFVLINPITKQPVSAERYLRKYGPIGSDGPLAELRPAPGDHEDVVVDNLRKLIAQLPEKLPPLQRGGLIAEAHSAYQDYSLGFHIHLGMPGYFLAYTMPNTELFFRYLIRSLDYFVALPAMVLEDTWRRRLCTGKYGKLSDSRLSKYTIEYRTPGGFFLRHPDYARGIMAIALAVAEDYLLNFETAEKELLANLVNAHYGLPPYQVIQTWVLDKEKIGASKELGSILRKLISLSSFKKHAKAIALFFELLSNNQLYSPQLLTNWQVWTSKKIPSLTREKTGQLLISPPAPL